MKSFELSQLDVIGAWSESEPPNIPWRSITPVFRSRMTGEVVWPVEVQGALVRGWSSAQDLDGGYVATPVWGARPHHILVKTTSGFEYIGSAEARRRKRFELRRQLNLALAALRNDDLEEAMGCFDRAYLIDPVDRVAAALRAGAAHRLRSHDPEWCAAATEDLWRAVEFSGDLDIVLALEDYAVLQCPDLKEELYRSARVALDDYSKPELNLESPVDESAVRIAVATAKWMSQYPVIRSPLPHRLLREVLRGNPSVTADALSLLEGQTGWSALYAESTVAEESYEGARAWLTEFERVSTAWYSLEVNQGFDRRAAWRSFVRETRSLTGLRDRRPWKRGEIAADQLRSYLGLNGEPIHSVVSFVEMRGVAIAGSLHNEVVHAIGTCSRNLPPCALLSKTTVERRLAARFSLLHELAHFLMHASLPRRSHSWVCSLRRGALRIEEEESEANAFAVYLLAPRDGVRALIGKMAELTSPGFQEQVMQLRECFGLTASQATEHIVNCFDDANQPRDRLWQLSQQLEDVARTRETIFDADRPDEVSEGESGAPLRGGKFARLVASAVESGLLTPSEQRRLLSGIKVPV